MTKWVEKTRKNPPRRLQDDLKRISRELEEYKKKGEEPPLHKIISRRELLGAIAKERRLKSR